MLENINITCNKYAWGSNTPPEEINLFSKSYTPTLIETVNLKQYLTDIDKLNFNFDTTDSDKGVNSLYFEDANVNMTVSGIADNSKMKDFFLINQNAFYTKWLIKIETSTLNFTGIVNQESIEETFSISNDSEQIKFTAQSFLSEFKNYYSNQTLPKESGLIDWEEDNWYTGDYDIWRGTPHQSLYLGDFLQQLFQYNSNPFYLIELDPRLADFRIFRYGGFRGNINTLSNNYRLKKCSYDAISRRGESKWGFLSKLSNSMGWIMYFDYEGNKAKLCIKNRSDNFSSTSYLSYSNFVEYSAIKSAEFSYDAVAIQDGEVYGGAGVDFTGVGAHRRSNSVYIYSDKLTLYNKTIPWYQWNNNFQFVGSKWMKLVSRGDKETIYAKIDEGATLINIVDNSIRTDKMLWIDGGDTGTCGYVFHKDSPFGVNDWPVDEKKDGSLIGEVGNTSIYYTGNYGGALYYKGADFKRMYYDPGTQEKIKLNYKKYLDTLTSNRIKVTYNGINFSPFSQASVSGNSELNGDYNILSMAIDLKNELTEFELQKTKL